MYPSEAAGHTVPVPDSPAVPSPTPGSGGSASLDAVVFDFDGLILDTETPLYEAWHHTYTAHGVDPIDYDTWTRCLGLADDDPAMIDPAALLLEHLGPGADIESINRTRRAKRDELMGSLTIRPGVVALIDQARHLGVPIAIASSSPVEWIESHLAPRGLLHHFGALSCVGEGVPGKPDPATYLRACALLGADPARSVALEDSPNGTSAAKAAGLFCVAVPAGVSERLDFSHADHVVPSLEHLDLTAIPGR